MKRGRLLSLLAAASGAHIWHGCSQISATQLSSIPVPDPFVRVTTRRQAALSAALLRPDTLAYYAARAGILFGSIWPSVWPGRAPISQIENRELSLVYPWGLGLNHTRQSMTGFDFTLGDQQIALAKDDSLAVAGGYLVVHDEQPSWITSSTNRASALRELQRDVTTPMQHYAGQLDHWIVVNEAINISDGNPYGLRNCIWRTTIGGDLKTGSDYVTQAFTAARSADATATLVYNDYGIEDADSLSIEKRASVLALVRTLKGAGLVDALGIQGHLQLSTAFDPSVFRSFLDSVYAMGLGIIITELDVNDQAAPSAFSARDAMVAAKVAAFLAVVLAHPGVTLVSVWGLSDKYSWLNGGNPRADGLQQRGDLLDANLNRKSDYYAARAAFPTQALSS